MAPYLAHRHGRTESASRETPPLYLLGFGLLLSWWFVQYNSSAALLSPQPSTSQINTLQMWSLGAGVVAALASIYLASRLIRFNRKRSVIWGAPLFASTGIVLTAVSYLGERQAGVLAIAGAVLSGTAQIFFLVMWGEVYASVGTKRARVFTPASVSIGCIGYLLISYLSPIAATVVTSILPLLSAVALSASSRALRPEAPPDQTPDRTSFPLPWQLAMSIGIFGLAQGLMPRLAVPVDISLFDAGNRLAILASGIIALVMLIGALVFSGSRVPHLSYRPVLPFVIAAFLALPFLGPRFALLANAVVLAGWLYFFILFWTLMSDLSFSFRLRPARVFGWGGLLSWFSMLVGTAIGVTLSERTDLSPEVLTAISLPFVYVLVLMTIFILKEGDLFSTWSFLKVSRANGHLEDASASVCAELSARYGLSSRESEILALLAQGRSVPFIAGELHLARSTVQTHAKHLYAKLDIHAKQDLLTFVKTYQDGGSTAG